MTFYEENGFQCADGPAFAKGYYCQKKLCVVATDRAYLIGVLESYLKREDCLFVKYSPEPRDGMHLGRVFLTDARVVGAEWAKLKKDPKLFCNVQDDDFTVSYR